MWRHPRTVDTGYDWTRPALYQHIAQVCERGTFDMVFFADLNDITDTYRGSMDPAIRHATQATEHDPSRPEACKILFGIQPILGATEAEAREKQELHNSLVSLEGGLAILSGRLDFDLSTLSLDGPCRSAPSPN
jgi:alkanesulfonate monooxygenase SsuD/methylene tetrahydromethanopterin reductase-like flavin-dependent oxidoreductase (luciferase family)